MMGNGLPFPNWPPMMGTCLFVILGSLSDYASGKLNIWKFANLGICESGNLEIREFGN
jgi:hypothetical protein